MQGQCRNSREEILIIIVSSMDQKIKLEIKFILTKSTAPNLTCNGGTNNSRAMKKNTTRYTITPHKLKSPLIISLLFSICFCREH